MERRQNTFPGKERRHLEQELIVALLCVAACVTLAISVAGNDLTRRAMDGVAGLLYWAERPAVMLVERLGQFHRWTEERRDLLMDLAELQEENRVLNLHFGRKSLDDLKKNSRPENRYPIVYRHPREWWESARINTGKESFDPGTAVFDGSDLVGVITSSGDGVAWVRLITSSQFFAPVVVAETREIGVVTGDDRGGVWLMYLPQGGANREGMHVLTALGSRLSAGFPVGVLSDEKRSIFPGTVEFRVLPAADVFRLQYVYVSLSAPSHEERVFPNGNADEADTNVLSGKSTVESNATAEVKTGTEAKTEARQ